MKRSQLIVLGFILVAISGLTYYIHYLVFRDIHHILIFLVSDLAFMFLEVLLVVIIIERVLARREKQPVMAKLNMIAGAFFPKWAMSCSSSWPGAMTNTPKCARA